jgi:hypothetical protein
VAELLTAWFESADGETQVSLGQGEDCCVRMDVRFHTETEDPLFAVALRNDLGHVVFAASTQHEYGPTGRFAPGEEATIRLRFPNWLAPGRYRLTASISRDGLGADAYDLRTDISSILVWSVHSGGGAADLPHRFEIERLSS